MPRNFMPNIFDSVITADTERKKGRRKTDGATGRGVKDGKMNECDATGKKCLWSMNVAYVLLLLRLPP